MTRKHFGMILILLLLLLSACSGREKYEPFTPLSKETVSPEREAAIQAALSGGGVIIAPTTAPVIMPTDELYEMPTFDEDAFFTEVDTSSSAVIAADASPFDSQPQQAAPTATPESLEPRPYDPNITMYGTSNGLTTYTLQAGEDLVCLGRRFGVSVAQLLSQNGLDSPDEAGVGDVILLPRNPNPWTMVDGYGRQRLLTHPATYTVKSGDTLFSIACAYGDVRPEDIATTNQLVLGEPLQPGLQISIP